MKHKNHARPLTVFTSSLLIVLMVVGIANAVAVGIDTFSVADQNITLTIPASAADYSGTSAVDGASGILGGERDLYLKATNTSTGEKTAKLEVITGDHRLSLSTDDGINPVFYQVEWDGNDNAANSIDHDGLGGVDLTDSSSNTGIHLRVLSNDIASSLKVIVYTSSTACSEKAVALPAMASGNILDLFLPFSGFSTPAACTSGAATFGNVGAVVLQMSASGSLDMSLAFIEADDAKEYGDLPLDEYGTNILNAYHTQGANLLRLGSSLDVEETHNESTDAFGDDLDGIDDEDGVTPTYQSSYSRYRARITANGCGDEENGCYVYGWIDWNNDGDFLDDGEDLISGGYNFYTTGTTYRILSHPDEGTQVPRGYYYLRFRVCTEFDDCDTPDGSAVDGEVEDYRFYLNPTSVDVESFSAGWQGPSVVVDWQTASEVNLTGFYVWRSDDAASHGARLNDVAIPPLTPGSLTGNAYSYPDDTAEPGALYHYWLETEYVGSSSVWYGPIQATSPVRVYLPLLWRSQ